MRGPAKGGPRPVSERHGRALRRRALSPQPLAYQHLTRRGGGGRERLFGGRRCCAGQVSGLLACLLVEGDGVRREVGGFVSIPPPPNQFDLVDRSTDAHRSSIHCPLLTPSPNLLSPPTRQQAKVPKSPASAAASWCRGGGGASCQGAPGGRGRSIGEACGLSGGDRPTWCFVVLFSSGAAVAATTRGSSHRVGKRWIEGGGIVSGAIDLGGARSERGTRLSIRPWPSRRSNRANAQITTNKQTKTHGRCMVQ